jgi:hypothetical protein
VKEGRRRKKKEEIYNKQKMNRMTEPGNTIHGIVGLI